ncbi:hypothetical protein PCE1_000290 [Barthelona sp. PCE]
MLPDVISAMESIQYEELQDGTQTGLNTQSFVSALLTFKSLFTCLDSNALGFVQSDFSNYIDNINDSNHRNPSNSIQSLLQYEIREQKNEDNKSASQSLKKILRLMQYKLLELKHIKDAPEGQKPKKSAMEAYKTAMKPHCNTMMRMVWKSAVNSGMPSLAHLYQRYAPNISVDTFHEQINHLIVVSAPVIQIVVEFLKASQISPEEQFYFEDEAPARAPKHEIDEEPEAPSKHETTVPDEAGGITATNE